MTSNWLTDDNISFILRSDEWLVSDYAIFQTSSSIGAGKVEVRTDIANIYNTFTRAKNGLDISNFVNDTTFTKKYTLFPIRVSGNHWGLFIIEKGEIKNPLQYQAYYTSSGNGVMGEEQQVRPLIQALTSNNIAITILEGQKQNNGHDCGVYLIFYIKEILETQQPQLDRKFSEEEIANFRQFWKDKIGEDKWCKEDSTSEDDIGGDDWSKLGISAEQKKEWFDEDALQGQKGFGILWVEALLNLGFEPEEGKFARWLKKKFEDEGHTIVELANFTDLIGNDLDKYRAEYQESLKENDNSSENGSETAGEGEEEKKENEKEQKKEEERKKEEEEEENIIPDWLFEETVKKEPKKEKKFPKTGTQSNSDFKITVSKQDLIKWMTEIREELPFEKKTQVLWDFWQSRTKYKTDNLTQFIQDERLAHATEITNLNSLHAEEKKQLEKELSAKQNKIDAYKILQQRYFDYIGKIRTKLGEYLVSAPHKDYTLEELRKGLVDEVKSGYKLYQEKTKLVADVAQLENDIKSAKEEITKQSATISNLNQELSEAKEEQTIKEQEIKDLQQRIKDAEVLWTSLKTLNNQLLDKIKEINQAKDQDKSNLETEKQQLETQIAEANKKIKNLQTKSENVEPNETEKQLLIYVSWRVDIGDGFTKIDKWKPKDYAKIKQELEDGQTPYKTWDWNKLTGDYINIRTKLLELVNSLLKEASVQAQINQKQEELQKEQEKVSNLQKQLDLETKTKEELAEELQKEKGWWDEIEKGETKPIMVNIKLKGERFGDFFFSPNNSKIEVKSILSLNCYNERENKWALNVKSYHEKMLATMLKKVAEYYKLSPAERERERERERGN